LSVAAFTAAGPPQPAANRPSAKAVLKMAEKRKADTREVLL